MCQGYFIFAIYYYAVLLYRLPLTIQWLKQEYTVDLNPLPPAHMPIAYGPVTAKVKKHKKDVMATQTKSTNSEASSLASASTNKDSNEKITTADDDDGEGYRSLFDRLSAIRKPEETNKEVSAETTFINCFLCKSAIVNEKSLTCLNEACRINSHVLCLAKHFLANEISYQLLPVEGLCPSCDCLLLWGELIRTSQGFTQYLNSS